VSIETAEQLTGMRRAGAAVAATLAAVRPHVAPGVTTAQLDALAARELRRRGARPSPALVYGFPGTLCISVEDEAVHGVPGDRVLRDGELVTLDCTAELDGFHADAAITVPVGRVAPLRRRLAAAADAALGAGLAAARPGTPVRRIGRAVERETARRGFTVLRELTGHGIGRTIHEAPTVPNVDDPGCEDVLTEGLVLTVEPIVGAGDWRLAQRDDGWTLATADGSPVAHAEHTIVVRRGAPLVLTA
jgi:methionyl aminopeptidase